MIAHDRRLVCISQVHSPTPLLHRNMLRRTPGTLFGPLSGAVRARAAFRSVQSVRASSSRSSIETGEHLQQNHGTSRPGRWIAATFAIGTGALLLTYYYDSRSVAHEHVVMPVVRALADAEDGHKIAIKVLSAPSWARPQDMSTDAPELRTEVRLKPFCADL